MILIQLYLSAIVEISLDKAVQSTTETRWTCSNNQCLASLAIDGDLDTRSRTGYHIGWWKAEMGRPAKIDNIQIYFDTESDPNLSFYSKLKVETRMRDSDDWNVCKGPFAAKPPVRPYVVRCDNVTVAKRIRITNDYSDGLYLYEVKVFGIVHKGKNRSIYKYPIFQ